MAYGVIFCKIYCLNIIWLCFILFITNIDVCIQVQVLVVRILFISNANKIIN